MRKYLTLLCAHVADVLPLAASLAAYSSKHFALVAKIVLKDVSGKLQLNFFNLKNVSIGIFINILLVLGYRGRMLERDKNCVSLRIA